MLIRGESGTGKELLAAAIHHASPRAARPFVKVHCAALSQSLLESELFGHVKGAFTGADRDRVGRFEQANGGTLFLDEIGDINLEVQTKLLRVLQEMSFERVGSSQPITVDVRILAATHQDLEALIRAGRFREDLYYRLNVICLHTPALRERREDIFELAVYFLNVHAQRTGKLVTHLDPEAVEALVAYDWPGNIRELENVLERAVVLADGPAVTLDDLPAELRQRAGAAAAAPAGGRAGSGRDSAATAAVRSSSVRRRRAADAPPRNGTRPTGRAIPTRDWDAEFAAYERQRLDRCPRRGQAATRAWRPGCSACRGARSSASSRSTASPETSGTRHVLRRPIRARGRQWLAITATGSSTWSSRSSARSTDHLAESWSMSIFCAIRVLTMRPASVSTSCFPSLPACGSRP